MSVQCIIVALLCAAAFGGEPEQPYDHQSKTYHSHFKPMVAPNASIELQAYFSPTFSANVTEDVLNAVSYGGTLDMHFAGFQIFAKSCNIGPNTCYGCFVDSLLHDHSFYFSRIVNAARELNVTVRLLTNDYGIPSCGGSNMTILDFLVLNGVQVKYYATTTYTHGKLFIVDSNLASVSSINLDILPFIFNREAGFVVYNSTQAGRDVIDFYQSVFDYDWDAGFPYEINGTYTAEALYAATHHDRLTGDFAPSFPLNNTYSAPPVRGMFTGDVTAFVAPDNAYAMALSDLKAATSSFHVFMYFVANGTFCSELLAAHTRGVNVTVLVSQAVLGFDNTVSTECYKTLDAAGLTVQSPSTVFAFAHQKVWIVDDEKVTVSTGDWTQTDTPPGNTFYNYTDGGPDWVQTNRDFYLAINSTEVADVFLNVIDHDFADGAKWTPQGPPPL